MKNLETRLTQKGQVTIPAPVRARLGLKPNDRVRFEVDGDDVKIKPASAGIGRHFGVVAAPRSERLEADEREAFERGVAEEAAAEDNA